MGRRRKKSDEVREPITVRIRRKDIDYIEETLHKKPREYIVEATKDKLDIDRAKEDQ